MKTIADLMRDGFWYCTACHKITEHSECTRDVPASLAPATGSAASPVTYRMLGIDSETSVIK
jgi:hypothetical protein